MGSAKRSPTRLPGTPPSRLPGKPAVGGRRAAAASLRAQDLVPRVELAPDRFASGEHLELAVTRVRVVAPATLSTRALGRATLARQMLLERERVSAVEAIERLAGLQAQEAKPPFAGLWTRVERFDREELLAALRGGDVVRATLMRATLHLMSARDFGAFRGPLQPAIGAALDVVGDRRKGISPADVSAAARDLLAGGPKRFDELRAALAEQFPDVDHRVVGYAVRLNLPLVMVPTDDPWGYPRNARFRLADVDIETPAAPDELVLRYLAAFGPASATDVQRWSALKGAKVVLDGLRGRLVTFRDERGRELFDLPDAPRPGEDADAPLRFLPEFDNLMLAHDDRTRVIADEHRGAVVTKNLRVRATVLWDGVVIGTWAIERKRDVATLRIAPFGRVPRGAKAALAEEGEALLRFAEPDARTFAVTA